MRWLKFFLSLLFTAALMYALLVPMGPVSFPAGAFLEPFGGFWQNGPPVEHQPDTLELELPNLKAPVEVVIDERRIPHIFAGSLTDLCRVQGYIHARDRLWQMEFQMYAAAGRLTELLGVGPDSVILKRDRYTRRKGLPWAAERSLAAFLEHPETKAALEAYTEGVNAYIEKLDPAHYPIEYKLLNYKPEPWTEFKSALFLKYMANTLASGADDLEYTRALNIFGRELFDQLYPEFPYADAPIVPARTRWDWRKGLPYPTTPENYHPDSMLLPKAFVEEEQPEGIGSNNWAVSGEKSSTGRPMLASDPHLSLNLPSIWYELQLNTPNLNAYGVSFPGVPGVIIGFNDSIAWGATNGSDDVLDYYRIQWKDDRKTEYAYDGQWLQATEEVEKFKIKGGATYYDTVKYTIHGPVIYDEDFGNSPVPLALRWMAHEVGNEALTFLRLNRGKNYQDYLEALSHYVCPAQNFVFASAAGDIAIWHNGRFVKKWPEQGRFVLDGAQRQHLWEQYIPREELPHLLNPEQNFVQSANQHPTDYRYPYYYTGNFATYRGRRLDYLLRNSEVLTPDDMKRFQLDNFGQEAADLLPVILTDLDTTAFTADEKVAYRYLRNWDYFYDATKVAPTLYVRWFALISSKVFRDEMESAKGKLDWPSVSTIIGILINEAESPFYKNVKTNQELTRQEIVRSTFSRMVRELKEDFPEEGDWTWGARKGTDFLHLLQIVEPFNRRGLETAGNSRILNATSRRAGPSWRMVVALGDTVQAWGIYPGGQTGNPGDKDYAAFIDEWQNGQLAELWFMKRFDKSDRPIRQKLLISPKKDQTEK